LGRINLAPRRGRVSLFHLGLEILAFPSSHLIYRGPLATERGLKRPLLDRGRIRGYGRLGAQAPGMELSGFGPGLEFDLAKSVFHEADGLAVDLDDFGTVLLEGFRAGRVDLRPEPGGLLFQLAGTVKGTARRHGRPGFG
jgi:hypothetical protein